MPMSSLWVSHESTHITDNIAQIGMSVCQVEELSYYMTVSSLIEVRSASVVGE